MKFLSLTTKTYANLSKAFEVGCWGFDEKSTLFRSKKTCSSISKPQKGDIFIFNVKGIGIVSAARIVSDYYQKDTPIWQDGIYPYRYDIEPILPILPPNQSLPKPSTYAPNCWWFCPHVIQQDMAKQILYALQKNALTMFCSLPVI